MSREEKLNSGSEGTGLMISSLRRGQESPYFKSAVEALEYARSFIVKGSTELKNNQRSSERFSALSKSIENIRDLVGEQVAKVWKMFLDEKLAEDTDNGLYNGLRSLVFNEVVKKLSLGNCSELSDLVLEFYYLNGSNNSVQLFYNNNHAYIVTENSLVIDPWLDRIYPISEISTYGSGFSGRKKLMSDGIKACFELTPHSGSPQCMGDLEDLRRAHKLLNAFNNKKLNEIITAIKTVDPAFESNIDLYDPGISRIYKFVKKELKNSQKDSSSNYLSQLRNSILTELNFKEKSAENSVASSSLLRWWHNIDSNNSKLYVAISNILQPLEPLDAKNSYTYRI